MFTAQSGLSVKSSQRTNQRRQSATRHHLVGRPSFGGQRATVTRRRIIDCTAKCWQHWSKLSSIKNYSEVESMLSSSICKEIDQATERKSARCPSQNGHSSSEASSVCNGFQAKAFMGHSRPSTRLTVSSSGTIMLRIIAPQLGVSLF